MEDDRIEINKSVVVEWVTHPITKERMLRIGPAKGSAASMFTRDEALTMASWVVAGERAYELRASFDA